MSGGQPEIVDNGPRYAHASALRSLAENLPRPLRVATGYVNVGGLKELSTLPGPDDRPVCVLLGAIPPPGLGEAGLVDEALQAGKLFDETLRRLRAERDFDAFPPSRRLEALQAVDVFLQDERVQVRRYTQRFLHGKAYLFADEAGTDQGAPRAALITSANLTAAGMASNLELGVVQYQPHVVDEAVGWFEELWAEAGDVKDQLRSLLFPEIPEYSPQQMFLRMLLEYYGGDLPEEPSTYDPLARFQRDGYRRALRIVEQHGGVLFADGVGTGKTHIGVEFVEEYARRQGKHVLVIAPAQLRDKTWNDALLKANLAGQVISFQQLAEDEQLARADAMRSRRVLALDKDVYRLVIVDEAHAFRSPDTTYYYALNRLLGGNEKALVLLTATPVNNVLWDLYHQIMLFARHGAAFAEPLGIRDLRQFFRDAGANDSEAISPQSMFPLIDAVAVRRDRRFLQQHYPDDTFADGTPVRFPRPRLYERRYDLDAAYPGAFARIKDAIGGLTMARYRPDSYRVDAPGPAGGQEALAGLIQSGLLKRFESSVYAALATVRYMLNMHEAVLASCEEFGAMPSPVAIKDLYQAVREGEVPPETVEEVLEGDESAIPLEVLNNQFVVDLRADRDALGSMLTDLEALGARDDPKLEELKEALRQTPAEKVAIFTTFTDTARYLQEALKDDPGARGERKMVAAIGHELDSDEREKLLERFCPKSVTGDPDAAAPDGEVDLLLSTDILSEGQNLQQAQAVISYDMPWNPQRIVQRNGRVIRLKSEHDEVYLYTMLPEAGELEEILRLEARLEAKIRAANASVGMESQVLASMQSEERSFADLREFADRLANGDETLLIEGEGERSGSFAGEAYRARLARARQEGEIPRLEAMPWGVGAAFVRHATTPDVNLPAVVFAAKDRRGKRHWRAVGADGSAVSQDLELLRLADPVEEPRAEIPSDFDLEDAWQRAVKDICATHNQELDPAARAVRLPASQRWALNLLRDPSLPERSEFAQADEALSVPRDQAVQRALSAIRREAQGDERKPLDAAEEIARIVLEVFGLRPARPSKGDPYELTSDDVGVIAYQVVLQS